MSLFRAVVLDIISTESEVLHLRAGDYANAQVYVEVIEE